LSLSFCKEEGSAKHEVKDDGDFCFARLGGVVHAADFSFLVSITIAAKS